MSEILKIVERVKSGATTARAEVVAALKRARDAESSHALLEILEGEALARADEIDARIGEIIARHPELDSGSRKTGEAWIPDQVRNDIEGEIGQLAGVPYVAKDNFLTTVGHTTAAARILENFQSPLDATAIERLNAEGAILIGKANLDSFAHGGSTENSAFGPTKNAVDDTRVAGGSSGGSAVVVAQGVVSFALGSDTGGSIRQPASFNGVVGFKSTYGMISRYGVVAMASSTDVVGPIARTVADIELLCEILSGQDGRDSTVLPDYFNRKKVLFVCQTNVGRSQMAKAMYNMLTNTDNAESAGLGVKDEQPDGTTISKREKIVAQELGIDKYESSARVILRDKYNLDISDWPRIQLEPKMLSEYDLVVNIAEKFQTSDWLRGENVIWWDIKDPGLVKARIGRLKAASLAFDEITKRVKKLIEIEESGGDFHELDDGIDDVVKNTTSSKENQKTVQVYEEHFQDFIDGTYQEPSSDAVDLMKNSLDGVRKDAELFEIGSGFGRDAQFMKTLGYEIQTSDAAQSFVDELKKRGFDAMKFNLTTDSFPKQYDFIFANAVLLHLTRAETSAALVKIYNALKQGGRFAMRLKQGEGSEWTEAKVHADRFFTYWNSKDIAKELKSAGFDAVKVTEPNEKWLHIIAEKQPKKLKIGLIKEFMSDGVDEDVKARTRQFVKKLTAAGHSVSEVTLPMAKYALPIYYIVVPAEISSNLARYDGVRYGARADAATLAEVYGRSRDAGFVDENKRRIMIGSYVLSSGFFDAYYLQAQKARTLLIGEFNKLFDEYDFLIGPVAPTPAYKIGENIDDPIKMYLADIMTVPASLAGLPAISLPNGASDDGLPIGVQIIGQMKDDARLLNFAKEMNDV